MNLQEKIDNHLYSFYRYYVASGFKENLHAPHIKSLANKLSHVYFGRYHRLCVAMPPRHSKSSMVTLAYPLWLIFHNPDLNIVIVNNTAGLSEKFGIALRELIKEHGAKFGVYLSDVKHSNSYLMFNDNEGNLHKGSIRLIGSNGSITGTDADYLIIDDPYKGTEDITPTLLQKKIDWFNTIIEQRIEPHTRLLILHTRWHSNDLIGYLKKNRSKDYEFIEYPALNKDNTPLWSTRYTTEILLKKREDIGERLFQSLYQQEPLDTHTNFFNLDHLHWNLPDNYTPVQSVRAWDIASSDDTSTHGDYTSGCYMTRTREGYAVITDLQHGRYGDNTKNHVLNTATADGKYTKIVIETGVAAAGRLLYNEWRQQLTGFNVEQAQPVTAKVDRATPLQNAIQDGLVYISISDTSVRQSLMNELSGFPLSEHDDIVDSMSHAFNTLFIDDKPKARLGVIKI